jgi:hypothetical protein
MLKTTMSSKQLRGICLVVIAFGCNTFAYSQSATFSHSSRTVYKCDSAGKISYSDEPCQGAKKLDVQPSRGFNRSTGRELIGADVGRERQREVFAEAVKPLTGMTSEQFAIHSRRMQLESNARSECQALDRQLSIAEQEEKAAVGGARMDSVRRELFVMRKRSRDLRC